MLEPIYHWPAKLTAADIPLATQVGAAIAQTSAQLFLTERGQGYEFVDVRNAALTLIQLFSDLAWVGRPWGLVAEAVRAAPGQLAGVTIFIRQHKDLASFSCVEVCVAPPSAPTVLTRSQGLIMTQASTSLALLCARGDFHHSTSLLIVG